MKKQPENLALAFRVFRLQHGITVNSLARTAGISKQRISEMELLERRITSRMEERLADAMEAVLLRQVAAAATALADFRLQHKNLFNEVPEGK